MERKIIKKNNHYYISNEYSIDPSIRSHMKSYCIEFNGMYYLCDKTYDNWYELENDIVER